MKKNKRDSIIAAAVTFGVALILLIVLMIGTIRYDNSLVAQASIPEIATIDEEEQFIEPEILPNLGEENAITNDEPAPAFKGDPELAPKENTRQVIPDNNPNPAPPVEKPATQTKEIPVKATTPSLSEEEKQKVTSKVANKFSSTNGSEKGTSGNLGAGGAGAGAVGSIAGRTFLGCSLKSVNTNRTSRFKVVIDVVVNAEGQVVSAKSRAGNPNEPAVISACLNAAKNARWSKKEGAPDANGVLTFTITPSH